MAPHLDGAGGEERSEFAGGMNLDGGGQLAVLAVDGPLGKDGDRRAVSRKRDFV
jgi:hypothetical protein